MVSVGYFPYAVHIVWESTVFVEKIVFNRFVRRPGSDGGVVGLARARRCHGVIISHGMEPVTGDGCLVAYIIYKFDIMASAVPAWQITPV